jgi:hypothetical protein
VNDVLDDPLDRVGLGFGDGVVDAAEDGGELVLHWTESASW